MWLNVGCGTHNAPAPWWNVDVVDKPSDDPLVGDYGAIHPDQIVPRGPLPFEDGTCDRIFLSHLLEHVEWGEPVLDLLWDVQRLLTEDGEVCIVGPDYKRTLDLCKSGALPWDLLTGVLEDARCEADLVGDWPEARHHWNCYESRVVMLLQVARFTDIRPIAIPGPDLDSWPVVAPANWQFAILVRQ